MALMARPFKNLTRPTQLWAQELVNRLKALEDLVALLGAATFIFDNSTSSADPGSGKFRLNNAVKASATHIFISNTTEGGIDIEDIFQDVAADDHLIIRQENDVTRNMHVTVSSIVDNTTWFDITIVVDASNGSEFQNNQGCAISIIRN